MIVLDLRIKTEIFWRTKGMDRKRKENIKRCRLQTIRSMKYKIFDDKKIKIQSKQELIASVCRLRTLPMH